MLAQWATKLAGLRVGGGDRWSGVLEAEDDAASSDGATRYRIARRITVPPGVALTQIYRWPSGIE